MLVFPNCKINLGLNIVHKRNDGYHDLETVFYPLPFKDALEIVRGSGSSDIEWHTTGLSIAGNSSDNLCIKAYHLLKEDFPDLPPLQMHLHKVIPMGAGLGGGSADGAFALKLINDYGRLGLSVEQLSVYALQLGSDCPFFIRNQPCFATGRGEKIQLIDLDLSQYQFLVISPDIHISTGWAFSQVTPRKAEVSVLTIIQQPVIAWRDILVNDFEQPVINAYPAIGRIKEQLYEQGAIYASMTGSGSTLFGIFDRKTPINTGSFSPHRAFLLK